MGSKYSVIQWVSGYSYIKFLYNTFWNIVYFLTTNIENLVTIRISGLVMWTHLCFAARTCNLLLQRNCIYCRIATILQGTCRIVTAWSQPSTTDHHRNLITKVWPPVPELSQNVRMFCHQNSLRWNVQFSSSVSQRPHTSQCPGSRGLLYCCLLDILGIYSNLIEHHYNLNYNDFMIDIN